jgi:hypothetical protein
MNEHIEKIKDFIRPNIGNIGKITLAGAGIFLVWVVIRLTVFYLLYRFFSEMFPGVMETLGLERDYSTVAVILAMAFAVVTWTKVFMWLIAGGSKLKLVIIAIIVSIAIAGGIEYRSRNIFFDQNTGVPLRYYVINNNGECSFSNKPGFDPTYGIKYEPATKEIVLQCKQGVIAKSSDVTKEPTVIEKVVEKITGSPKPHKIYDPATIPKDYTVFKMVNDEYISVNYSHAKAGQAERRDIIDAIVHYEAPWKEKHSGGFLFPSFPDISNNDIMLTTGNLHVKWTNAKRFCSKYNEDTPDTRTSYTTYWFYVYIHDNTGPLKKNGDLDYKLDHEILFSRNNVTGEITPEPLCPEIFPNK